MIKEIPSIIHRLYCDNCGEVYSTWDWKIDYFNKEYLIEDAKEDSWIEINGKHYCPKCYHLNEKGEFSINENSEAASTTHRLKTIGLVPKI